MSGDTAWGRLTDEQRRQVEQHLPLVTVHLRGRMRGRGAPTREREWDDLFQEGCCGLIQAVRTYSPESGIPFAAYALPRIHTAVSRAMRGAFATIKQPLYPRRAGRLPDDVPAVLSIDFDPEDRRAHPRHDPAGPPDAVTIGDRIRNRYLRAVQRAADRMTRTRPARPDRADLVRRIVEQRMLVPEPEHRVSLRAIARDTESSYARVAKCDKRLGELVRAELEADPTTQRLRRAARRSPDGLATPVRRSRAKTRP